jgi:hypothetical protein
MITLRIEHQVRDFDAWKVNFDRDPIGRARAGVRAHRVYRLADDQNCVMIDLDFDDVGAAEALLATLRGKVWQSAEAISVLIGTPKTRIVEVAENKAY